jgi:hypothetical protein
MAWRVSFHIQQKKHTITQAKMKMEISLREKGKSFAIISALVRDCIVNFVTFKHIMDEGKESPNDNNF